jgi:hypothetical protein
MKFVLCRSAARHRASHFLPLEVLISSVLCASTRVTPLSFLPHTSNRKYSRMASSALHNSRQLAATSRRRAKLRTTMTTMASLNPKLNHKERILILGSGWAGYILSRKLSPAKYDVTVISPRSYFVFTPLLNDTAIGSLEFPQVIEPVRDRRSSVDFAQGWARSVDVKNRTLTVESSVTEGGVTEAEAVGESEAEKRGIKTRRQSIAEREQQEAMILELQYDKLVVSVGCISQTFGTKGIKENALFLKDIGDARKIRRRILECFELAATPNCSPQQ